jgi:hypothetical protein
MGVFIEVAYGWGNLAELAELAATTAAYCAKSMLA